MADTNTWNEMDERLLKPWESLIRKQHLNPSLRPQWIEAVANSHSLLPELRVFSESFESELSGIFPYIIRTRPMNRISLRWLEPAFNMVSYHPELICNSKSQNLLRDLLQRESSNWDIAYIHNVSPNGSAARQITAFSNEYGHVLLQHQGESSPYMTLNGTWEDFLVSKRKKFRYKLKRRARDIGRAGEIRMRWYERNDDPDTLLQDMLLIEEGSWKMDSSMSITQCSEEIEYYRQLIPFLSESGLLFANVLYLDDNPISYSLCYNDNGVIGQLKTSFLDSHKHLSPGAIVIEHAIKRAFDIDALEFDFLGDIMPHKMEWSDSVREHQSYFLFSRRLPIRLFGKAKQLVSTIREQWLNKVESEVSVNA